jgi:hypothetical protein
MMRQLRAALMVGALVGGALTPYRAIAHETNGSGQNLPQAITSHADITCPAGGAATPVLAVNTYRVIAQCIDTGSSPVNVGDATVSQASHIGSPLQANGPGVDLDATGAIYCSSTSGTTINCQEIVRP